MKCALCKNLAQEGSKLCLDCDEGRLEAASHERTITGSGLTYSNVEKYSEDNWIRAVKKARKREQ